MSKSLKIAVQLYTLRDKTQKNMAETLAEVARQGYAGVELAGFQGMTPEELQHTLTENGLAVASAHVGMADLEENTSQWCQTLRLLGASRVTIPGISGTSFDSEEINQTAARMNELQKALADDGIELSYHNHEYEFENNRYARLLDACPALKIELDTYWAVFAGVDPIAQMKVLGDRLSLIHIKDMSSETLDERSNRGAPNPHIMEGVLDIAAILEQAKAQGLEWAIVEMDSPIGDSLDAVRISRDNLRRAGY